MIEHPNIRRRPVHGTEHYLPPRHVGGGPGAATFIPRKDLAPSHGVTDSNTIALIAGTSSVS